MSCRQGEETQMIPTSREQKGQMVLGKQVRRRGRGASTRSQTLTWRICSNWPNPLGFMLSDTFCFFLLLSSKTRLPILLSALVKILWVVGSFDGHFKAAACWLLPSTFNEIHSCVTLPSSGSTLELLYNLIIWLKRARDIENVWNTFILYHRHGISIITFNLILINDATNFLLKQLQYLCPSGFCVQNVSTRTGQAANIHAPSPFTQVLQRVVHMDSMLLWNTGPSPTCSCKTFTIEDRWRKRSATSAVIPALGCRVYWDGCRMTSAWTHSDH